MLLVAGLTFLCLYPTIAQDYPHWLRDPGEEWDEYPTSIASVPDLTATVGFFQSEYGVYDLGYNFYYGVGCNVCNQYESIFVTWKEESSANTWTAQIFADGIFNNQVNVQSAPQVDINSNGEVYVSFTFRDIAVVQDVSGNYTNIYGSFSSYDLAVVKFDANGDYLWHILEAGDDDDFVTDLDYNENTNILAIGGYVEGSSGLVLGGGAAFVPSFSWPSVLGANFPYGNAFVATYKDNGGSASFAWAEHVDAPTYSTDVVQDDGGNVFLSGIYYEAKGLAGQGFSSNFTNGGYIHNYFIVGFDHNQGTPFWAESYGSASNELTIAPDKHLRYSSLAINPQTSDLYHAFVSTGSNSGVFDHFGTYVNWIDPSNGNINTSTLIGNPYNISGTTYPGSEDGCPTYNPNIAVADNGLVFLSGNYLLSDNGSSALGIAFEEMEIGGTYLNHGMTNAGSQGYPEVVGWYTTLIDMGAPGVFNENINLTYVPANFNNVYNQLPVYGTSQDFNHLEVFYTALGFKYGELDIDLTTHHGQFNNYQNTGGGVPQYDGLLVRTFAHDGQRIKPNNPTTTQGAAHGDRTSIEDLAGSNSAWLLAPNPVAAGQTLLWKNEGGEEVVDYIRLVDLTGRVLKVWKQPKSTAQGFQLLLGELPTGTYLLEASGVTIHETTLVTVK